MEELQSYGTGTMTTGECSPFCPEVVTWPNISVFLERVFQECLTYEGEMDYKTYLDFVLAIENKREPAALQYLFRLLDIQGKNYLTRFDLNYFFRAIQQVK